MIAERHLIKLGLSEKEAKLYIAALQLGSGSVQEIAKKADVKRPTAYVVLDQLVQKGLVSKKPSGGGHDYIAESPEKLETLVDQQKFALSNALPLLKDIYKEEQARPHVKIYEGLEGMKKVYFDTVWKSKTPVYFFSSIRRINQKFPELLGQWLTDNKDPDFQKDIKELVNPDREDLEYAIKTLEVGHGDSARVVPKDFPRVFTGTDNAIFDDKVMFQSLEGKLFTTLIQNKTLAESMRTLFLLAWDAAVPIEKFITDNKEEYPDLYKQMNELKKAS